MPMVAMARILPPHCVVMVVVVRNRTSIVDGCCRHRVVVSRVVDASGVGIGGGYRWVGEG